MLKAKLNIKHLLKQSIRSSNPAVVDSLKLDPLFKQREKKLYKTYEVPAIKFTQLKLR